MNGKAKKHGQNYSTDYLTDVLVRTPPSFPPYSANFIKHSQHCGNIHVTMTFYATQLVTELSFNVLTLTFPQSVSTLLRFLSPHSFLLVSSLSCSLSLRLSRSLSLYHTHTHTGQHVSRLLTVQVQLPAVLHDGVHTGPPLPLDRGPSV